MAGELGRADPGCCHALWLQVKVAWHALALHLELAFAPADDLPWIDTLNFFWDSLPNNHLLTLQERHMLALKIKAQVHRDTQAFYERMLQHPANRRRHQGGASAAWQEAEATLEVLAVQRQSSLQRLAEAAAAAKGLGQGEVDLGPPADAQGQDQQLQQASEPQPSGQQLAVGQQQQWQREQVQVDLEPVRPLKMEERGEVPAAAAAGPGPAAAVAACRLPDSPAAWRDTGPPYCKGVGIVASAAATVVLADSTAQRLEPQFAGGSLGGSAKAKPCRSRSPRRVRFTDEINPAGPPSKALLTSHSSSSSSSVAGPCCTVPSGGCSGQQLLQQSSQQQADARNGWAWLTVAGGDLEQPLLADS